MHVGKCFSSDEGRRKGSKLLSAKEPRVLGLGVLDIA